VITVGRARCTLPDVYNAIGKEVTTLIKTAYITAETVMDFLCRPKEKYCDKPVILVLDNAKYQHCKAAMEKAGDM
jgi:hypothetical protein